MQAISVACASSRALDAEDSRRPGPVHAHLARGSTGLSGSADQHSAQRQRRVARMQGLADRMCRVDGDRAGGDAPGESWTCETAGDEPAHAARASRVSAQLTIGSRGM